MNRNNKSLLVAATGAAGLLAARAILRRVKSYSFRDRVVLITGGSRGLGLVMARELAHQGAKLAICARDKQELQRAYEDLNWRTRVFTVQCDITDRAQVDFMVRAVEEHYGSIDALINNAGVIEVGPAEVMTLEDYETAMKTHFWGPLYAILSVLPQMRRRSEGRIVNISSIGGKISVPHLLPYSASKFALVGLSEGLRAELAKDRITVTTVCPGLMRTGSPRNATFKGQHRSEYAWFAISDSLPLTSMSAERAARQVIAAARRGDAEVVLTIQAKFAALFHGAFPGLTADILGAVNRLLPASGGIGERQARGEDSQSSLAPSWLTALTEKAARENNEMA